MIIQGTKVQMVENAASLLHLTCETIIRKQGQVVLAVPGGRSVTGILKRVASLDLEWQKVHIFMLDERLVPGDHPDSNSRLVKESLGSSLVAGRVHPFQYDAEKIEESVTIYGDELDRFGGSFDIVLASSGEDGHIGSLFPDHPSVLAKNDRFILVNDSPKPPSTRISASVELLRRSDTGILLFFGAGKRNALRAFCDSDLAHVQCPAKIITMMPTYHVFTDQEVEHP